MCTCCGWCAVQVPVAKDKKWAPPDGMSFKEFKEQKKRLKLKRSGFL